MWYVCRGMYDRTMTERMYKHWMELLVAQEKNNQRKDYIEAAEARARQIAEEQAQRDALRDEEIQRLTASVTALGEQLDDKLAAERVC
jgi:hypothetical protein